MSEKTNRKLDHEGLPIDGDSYNTPEWLTEIIGPVDVDPCSNEHSTVQAAEKYTKETNGCRSELLIDKRSFINYPYSHSAPWWDMVLEAAKRALAYGFKFSTLVLCKAIPSESMVNTIHYARNRPEILVDCRILAKRVVHSYRGYARPGSDFASMLVAIDVHSKDEWANRVLRKLDTKGHLL